MTSAIAGAPATPAPPDTSDPRRWAGLGVMCLALLVVGIDATIVDVALPSPVRGLGASSTQLQWIVDAYTTVDSGYGHVALVLVIVGAGMGLAMAPATDSIMGSLPPAKAGVGSAMDDTTREIGGALGVAILGSVATAAYAASIVADPGFTQLQAASPETAEQVVSSVGAASVAVGALPAAIGQQVTAAADSAFVDAIGRGTAVGAEVALAAGWSPCWSCRPVLVVRSATRQRPAT